MGGNQVRLLGLGYNRKLQYSISKDEFPPPPSFNTDLKKSNVKSN